MSQQAVARAVGHRLPPSPWARVQRVQLVRREVREYLPPSAVQMLLARAEVVVEGDGELGAAPVGTRRVYATVMVTIDLERGASLFREPADEATAQRVAELIEATPAIVRALVAYARPELARIAGVPGDALEISLEHTARADGSRILIDGDAVGVVAAG